MPCIKALATIDCIIDNGRFFFIAFLYGLQSTLIFNPVQHTVDKINTKYRRRIIRRVVFYKRAIRKLRFGHSWKRVREKQGPEKPERSCRSFETGSTDCRPRPSPAIPLPESSRYRYGEGRRRGVRSRSPAVCRKTKEFAVIRGPASFLAAHFTHCSCPSYPVRRADGS